MNGAPEWWWFVRCRSAHHSDVGFYNREMATSFHPSDLQTCFGLDCENAPEFKLVEWHGAGRLNNGEEEEAGVGVSLLCRTCLIDQLEAFRDELAGTLSADIPTQAFLALPIRMIDEQVKSLQDEITPHVWINPDESVKIC